ncbi:hypothetical protein GCM10008933_34160 [Paenibacillus motobuensis]|uniref:Transposase n=1 Tax=Paenibacillus motobuensis TaxID=295324 RepID=A0ABN0YMS7_9BACL
MIPDRRGVYSIGTMTLTKIKLTDAIQYMTDLPPMDQITAMKDRYPREILE